MSGLRCLPAGDAGVLAEFDTLEDTLALFQVLGAWPAGVEDVIPAARTLLVLFQPAVLSARDVADWLKQRAQAQKRMADSGQDAARHTEAVAVRRIKIPVRYNGQDLESVAELLGLTRAELIERHTGTDYIGAFAGFAPGFVYLAGGDPCFHGVPRLPAPRVRVPGSSVAIAGDFSAIYPSDSPGGWQLLGETPWRMWDLNRAEPALIQPGFQVRFLDMEAPGTSYSLPSSASGPVVAPDAVTSEQAVAPVQAGAKTEQGDSGQAQHQAVIEVRHPGVQTLFQDEGRPGLTHLGVSRSGALDRTAMHRANRLVANPPETPVLEQALGGLKLVCHGKAVVAVVGALAPVIVTSASGMRLPAAADHPITLNDGDELRIGHVRAGVRCYVAVRGGWEVAPVLGSTATDVLAGMGPAPLKKGDKIAVGSVASAKVQAKDDTLSVAADTVQAAAENLVPPQAGDQVVLDVMAGPRDDWFDSEALNRLVSQDWVVTPQSNRVGMRLAGEQPLVRSRQGELPSEGVVAGSLQIPPSGQPVLFLADHPLTGGYPVIAVVLAGQLDKLAQVPVGVRLRFRCVESLL